MSPLAERIATLLSPEHWQEWAFSSGGHGLVHGPSGLEVYSDVVWVAISTIDDRGVFEPFRLYECWRLCRLVRRLKRWLNRERKKQCQAEFEQRLQTAEEKAIEELLR